jgi:CheY-like chemotaxis protein
MLQLVLHTLSACEPITGCLRRLVCCGFASANYVKPIEPALGGLPPVSPDIEQVPAAQSGMFIGIADDLVVSSVSSNSSNVLLADNGPLLEKVIIPLQKLRVLIVEDNAIAVMVLQRFGRGLGFVEENVKCALDGTAGVREFLKHKPHLVFMDRNMPIEKGLAAIELRQELEAIGVLDVIEIKNGVDATLAIRKSQKCIGVVPVIICISDDTSEDNVEKFTAAGADGFYHKPFSSGSPPLKEFLRTYFEFVD